MAATHKYLDSPDPEMQADRAQARILLGKHGNFSFYSDLAAQARCIKPDLICNAKLPTNCLSSYYVKLENGLSKPKQVRYHDVFSQWQHVHFESKIHTCIKSIPCNVVSHLMILH